MNTCDICRFWVKGSDQPRGPDTFTDEGGECRRRSPRGGAFSVYLTGSKKPQKVSTVMFPWPPTHAKDWCGDYEPTSLPPKGSHGTGPIEVL